MKTIDPVYDDEMQLINPGDGPISVTDLRDSDDFLEALDWQLDRFGLELVVWEDGGSDLIWSIAKREEKSQ